MQLHLKIFPPVAKNVAFGGKTHHPNLWTSRTIPSGYKGLQLPNKDSGIARKQTECDPANRNTVSCDFSDRKESLKFSFLQKRILGFPLDH